MYLLELVPELEAGKTAKRAIWIDNRVIYDESHCSIRYNTGEALAIYSAIQNDWELVKEPEELKKIQKFDEAYHGWDEVIDKINEIIDILNSKEGSKK